VDLRASISSALWVGGTHALMVLLKLVSTIVLSRLLFPEAFGEILIVMSIFTLIELVSDVGLQGSIINNPRGEKDASFVNTIWTLKILRALMISGVLILVSMSAHLVYENIEQLDYYLRIAALNAFILGFTSTKVQQMERRMHMMRPAIVQIGARAIALASTIIFAIMEPSAAAIMWGESVAALATVVLSHFFLQGTSNAFFIERAAFNVAFRYGKWIFLSTLLTWVVQESNKFVLGLIMTAEIIGFYALAFNIASIIKGFLTQFANRWTFPMYTKLLGTESLDITALRIRLVIAVLAGVAIAILGGFSSYIVDLVYDDRYTLIHPLITIIAIGSLGLIVSDCYMPIFKANADSWGLMKMRMAQALILGTSLYLGYQLNGAEGVVIATAFGQLIMGPVTAFCARVHFTKKRYLLDSLVYTLPFFIWLVLDMHLLSEIFH